MWWGRKKLDEVAVTVDAMSKLLSALTEAEIRKIEATQKDRDREYEQRQRDREAARAARQKAAENARERRTKVRAARQNPGACKLCNDPFAYPFTIEERDAHLYHAQAALPLPRNGDAHLYHAQAALPLPRNGDGN
jgi:hypothetical protein